ncbi:hypothetical protein JT55_01205 [Rhodovulum sp. NI22]|nr:hypothetical protein JT55_01205 [Rhodovulum sp. NI22]
MTQQMILLVTRPRRQAVGFARSFRVRFGEEVPIIISPALEVAPAGDPPVLDGISGLIFTSANGVEVFSNLTDDRRLSAYCVGAATAAVARGAGLEVALVAQNADDLVAGLLAAPPGGVLLHLHGVHTRGAVAQRLAAGGQPCRAQVIYDQVAQGLSLQARGVLSGRATVLLPLFSPRSAALVAEAAQSATAPLALAALSPAVRAAWAGPEPALECTAHRPDSDAMLDALKMLIDAVQRLEGGDHPS